MTEERKCYDLITCSCTLHYRPHRNKKDMQELKNSLDKMTQDGAKNDDVILGGDFNCPDINWDNNTVGLTANDPDVQLAVIDITASKSNLLTQVHDQPTCGSNILGVIFTSNTSLLKSSSSIPGISDHNMVVADFDIKPHTSKQKPRKCYKFQKANWDKLKTDLEITAKTIQKQYNDNQSADDMWTYFKNSLQNSMDRHIPSASTKKHSRLPWINRPLLRLPRQKKRQYQKARTTQDLTKYRSIQKRCKREIRRAEWRHINSTIQEGLDNNNTKPFWNFVKVCLLVGCLTSQQQASVSQGRIC